ncbi:hypothetical protein BDV98DRAFT_622711, partial [Pterulicium gracile]
NNDTQVSTSRCQQQQPVLPIDSPDSLLCKPRYCTMGTNPGPTPQNPAPAPTQTMTGYIKQISIPTDSALTTDALSLSDCNWGTWSPKFLKATSGYGAANMYALGQISVPTAGTVNKFFFNINNVVVVAAMICSVAKLEEDYLEDRKGKNGNKMLAVEAWGWLTERHKSLGITSVVEAFKDILLAKYSSSTEFSVTTHFIKNCMADIIRNSYPNANAFIKITMTLATEENLKGIYNFSIDKYAAGGVYPTSILEEHLNLEWDTKSKKLKDAKVNDNLETVLATTSSKGKMCKCKNHNTTNCNTKGGGADRLTNKEVKAKKAADAHACPKKCIWKPPKGTIYHFVDGNNGKTIASIQPEEAHIAAIFATPANVTPAQIQKVINDKCFLVDVSNINLGTFRKALPDYLP